MQILLLFILLAAVILFEALVIFVVTRFFKVNNANYKTSLAISAVQWVALLLIGIIMGAIFTAIGMESLKGFLTAIMGAWVFHRIMQKYYNTDLKKNIYIYIVFTITSLVISTAIIIPFRMFVAQPFYVKGAAMEPAIYDNDYLFVSKFSDNYERGDIIVFWYPNNQKEIYVKRIVGLPGEKVQIKNGSVYFYNEKNPGGYRLRESYLNDDVVTIGMDDSVKELAENEFFVLGDNRDKSKDSRSFGALKREFIIGKMWFKSELLKSLQ